MSYLKCIWTHVSWNKFLSTYPSPTTDAELFCLVPDSLSVFFANEKKPSVMNCFMWKSETRDMNKHCIESLRSLSYINMPTILHNSVSFKCDLCAFFIICTDHEVYYYNTSSLNLPVAQWSYTISGCLHNYNMTNCSVAVLDKKIFHADSN